jgi:hypothetical protein
MFISIKDRGLIFNFKGKEYRTPVKLEISDRDFNEVMFSLKRSGIEKFKIFKGIEANEQSRVEQNKQKIIKENITLELILENINKRFDNLENLIYQINVNNNPEISKNQSDNDIKTHKVPPRKKVIEPNVEEFIPTPSLDFEIKINNVIDSSKLDKKLMNDTINNVDKIKSKRGGFSK